MALTKDQKSAVVAEVSELLTGSKMTVVANYKGVTVKSIQALRKQAKDSGTVVKVVKNRLVKQAIGKVDSLKNVETNELKEQLLYAFNSEDEVSPAKALSDFAKTEPALQFVGAITAEGKFISAEEVKALANLPSKNQLIAGIVNTLSSPLNGAMSALSGNLHGYLKAIEASKS
ncbi:50S ribosomal protein L10 [Candidatus Nomurabacteria bacterium]|nr:50S ribosomal protein L10 [Candidatus Saccharibacteria bacterium]MCB9839771.1 50S ribosomal protein L10 [Candidatus Nomurabacteria bacterium]